MCVVLYCIVQALPEKTTILLVRYSSLLSLALESPILIFGNKQCEDNHVISVNGMNIKEFISPNFLGYILIPI